MKIAEYNEMMAYLLRPASLEEKLKELEEKYPGSVKPANELPPIQDPFKDFEDRNPRETAAYGGRMGFQEAGLAHPNRKTLTAKEKKLIDAYEERTGLKYADQSGAQQWKIRNNPNTGKNQAIDAGEFSEEVKARIKKYQKEYDEGSVARKADIRSGKFTGAQLGFKKVDDPERLKAIKDYVKKFKKEKGVLPTKNEIREHFVKTTGSNPGKSVTLLVERGELKDLPTGYGMKSSSIVDDDVKKLLKNKNIIDTLDSGKFPTTSQIKNILKVDPTVAEVRAIDLGQTLAGNRDIRFYKAPTKYKKLSENYLDKNVGDMFKATGSKSRAYYEKGLTKLLNLPKNINKVRADIVGKITNIIPELKGKINVDEIGSLTASMRRGSGPYAIFGQVLGSDFNQHVKGLGIDKTKSNLEKRLTTDVLKNDPQRLIEQKNYNEKVKKFEADANQNNPAKKVKGLKLSFEPPSETIKNKKIYNQYKDLFDAHYEKTGYSFEVPADRESIVDISKKLDNKSFQDTIKNRFKNLINRPGPRGGKIGLTTALATLAGTGFALADDMTPNEEGLSTAEKTGIGAGVAGGAYAARKPILKTLGKIARPFGFPAVAAGFALNELTGEDPNLGIAGAELLAPELIKKGASTGTGIMSKIGRVAANPFGKLARGFTPVGLGLMGIEGVRMGMEEQDRINEMRMNEPDKYEEYLDELESYGDFSAWSEKNQDHHQNQGQHHRGWILIIILLRQWNWRK